MQQLSLSARPKSLDRLVGQARTVELIRAQISSGRTPKAWLLCGPTGTGKTTTARILAVSLQCTHAPVFGKPCDECQAMLTGYDIYETNCAKVRGIRELEQALEGSDLYPRFGKYRIYILDEVHRATEDAQGLALKYLEDSAESTLFILCTTEPHLLLSTLKSRCAIFKLRPLQIDDIELLVGRLLKRIKSDRPADRLASALAAAGVTYPRLIANAVEKYAAGADLEEAITVIEGEEANVKALTRAIIKGDWEDARHYLKNADPSDVRNIRLGLLAYLRVVLLENPIEHSSNEVIAAAIDTLSAVERQQDIVIASSLAAALFKLCKVFAERKL